MAKKLRMLLLLAIGLALVLVVAQNSAPVRAHFLWMTAELPVFVMLFLTASAGFVAGLLVAVSVRGRAKPRS